MTTISLNTDCKLKHKKEDSLPEFERILCSRVTELSHTVKRAQKTLQALKTELKSEENNKIDFCNQGDFTDELHVCTLFVAQGESGHSVRSLIKHIILNDCNNRADFIEKALGKIQLQGSFAL